MQTVTRSELIKLAQERLPTLPPEQQAEAKAALSRLRKQFEANPLQAFEPYPKQAEFLSSRHRTKGFFAGDRAGKTEVGVVDDLINCVDRDCLPEHLQRFKRWEPPFFMRIVFPKFGQGDLAVMEKFRALCPKSQLRGGSFDKALEKQPNLRLHFKNGSWIVFNTGDQDRDVHAGVKLHRVHFDEEPLGERGLDIYQENRSRLVDFAPESQMMFTMTPKNGLTWVRDEVYDRRDDDNVFCLVASMYDNPYLPIEEIRLRESEMSEEEAQAAIHGQFVAFGGRVLNLDDRHMIDPPSPDWVRRLDSHYVCIDPGWKRGGVIFGGFDEDNALVIYDELYPERLTPDQIAPLIRAKNKYWLGRDEPLYLIDPASRGGELTSGETVETAFNRAGIYPRYAQNDRLAGALQLKARLQAKPTPGIFVSKACTNLLWESERWVVARDEDAEQFRAKVKGAGGGFATIGPDHLCDGARYLSLERLWWTDEAVESPSETWVPGTAPSGAWIAGHAPRSAGAPMGRMS